MGQENIDERAPSEIRGDSVFNRPATKTVLILSGLIDLAAVIFLSAVSLDFVGLTPLPGMGILCLVLAIGFVYWASQLRFLGITCGHRVWRIVRKNGGLFLPEALSPIPVFISTLITTVAVLVSISTFRETFVSHPLWIKGTQWNLRPFVPAEHDKWLVVPFFYTMGGWPKEFAGNPVYYTVPYEKGPPIRFVGRVIASWSAPDIKLTLEGPKTREKPFSSREVKSCILKESLSFPCLRVREASYMRHVREIAAISPRDWDLKWFEVENPSLFPEERTQGIYLSAVGKNVIQDRFILINPQGMHQTITLTRPQTEQGRDAFGLVLKTIGNLRNFPDLDSGRAWINRELGQVKLDSLRTTQNLGDFLGQMNRVQSLLISRLTVDPTSYDSFFHLAGTSLMLVERAKGNPELHLRIKSALHNIQSAHRYSQDINAKDPRATQIENMWIEAQKN